MIKLAMTILVCTLSFNSYASFNEKHFHEASRLINNKVELEKCSDRGNDYCTCYLGEMHYKEKSYDMAYTAFQKCSKNNEPSCDSHLGEMYLEGNGVLQNEDKALKYFLKSAQKGVPASAFNLGRIYITRAAHIDYHEKVEFNYNVERAYAWLKVAKALGVEKVYNPEGKSISMSSHIEMIKKLLNQNQLKHANSLASDFCAITEGCVQ